MHKDFLIIGRGLAGSILSIHLAKKGIAHDVIDSPALSTSSKVAAGLINPVVLKRLKLVSGASSFITNAFDFYEICEKESHFSFFHRTPIAHIFQSTREVNDWNEKAGNPAFSPFLDSVIPYANQFIPAPHGLGIMKNTAWIDTMEFLRYHEKTVSQSGSRIIQKQIGFEDLQELKKQYTNIILCTGHLMRTYSEYFSETFTPTRGEVMIIETDQLPDDYILHGPVFILPLGNNQYKVGATYHWDNLQDITTSEGFNRLETDLRKIYNGPYKLIQHHAGVRPNTKDRKPLLGSIDENIYCFNGLGSRGALMAPLLASQLLNYILHKEPLPPQYDLERFRA